MVSREPYQGGAAWAVLQYVLGLQRLGHTVTFVEPIEDVSAQSIRYLRDVCESFGVSGTIVSPTDEFQDFDLALNLSGLLPAAAINAIPVRVYVDLDPGFNQIWHSQGIDRGFDGHSHFVTVGQAIGEDACAVPTESRVWVHTLPPVVLHEWTPRQEVNSEAFTTVANLRSYGSLAWNGLVLGQKVHSLRQLTNLPRRTGHPFVLAMTVHANEHTDLAALEEAGWQIADPREVAGTPQQYRDFVTGSRAEIGIAKSGYVASRCGWFSDRSACYLASGRPVVAQDTGFSSFLPSGEGLLTFVDEDAAVEAVEKVTIDYERHSRAARRLAIDWLDSDRVLTKLLDRVLQ
jgi:hypothetical protein